MDSDIVHFFSNRTPFDPSDAKTTFEEVLNWDNDMLEARHDYIQHLFPLPERSAVNIWAPAITKEVAQAFHSSSTLQSQLRRATKRIYHFYGLRYDLATQDGAGASTLKARNFDRRARDSWLNYADHNHLRITRIIRCLRVLGLVDEAHRFAATLLALDEAHGHIVRESTRKFWCRAAEGPLYLAPDLRQQIRWLRDSTDDGTWDESNKNPSKWAQAIHANAFDALI